MNIKNYITLTTDVKEPTVGNNGYSLDIYSPVDLYLNPGAHIDINSGFILNLPDNIFGVLAPKVHLSDKFEVTSGQIIHPGHDKEIKLTLKYSKSSISYLKAGEPLLQIVFLHGIKLDA